MIDEDFKSGEFVFYYTRKEYAYIKDAIDLISKNLDESLHELYEKIEGDLVVEYEKNHYNLTLEEFKTMFSDNFEDVKYISSTINESLIIKIYTIFEKAMVNFSFEVREKYGCKIPPDFGLKAIYSDIERAIDYIALITDIDMKNVCNYEYVLCMKKLRNKLGHGNTFLKFKKDEYSSINSYGEILKIIHENGNDLICRINDDTKILYLILKEFKKIIVVLNELNFDMWRSLEFGWGDKIQKAYSEKNLYEKRGNIIGIKN
ncbi:MAG: hypothetical protein PHW64_02685 [Sulfuricurvum sp.]|nr:hypothetical protein [Sulfuricurvum sp.]